MHARFPFPGPSMHAVSSACSLARLLDGGPIEPIASASLVRPRSLLAQSMRRRHKYTGAGPSSPLFFSSKPLNLVWAVPSNSFVAVVGLVHTHELCSVYCSLLAYYFFCFHLITSQFTQPRCRRSAVASTAQTLAHTRIKRLI